MSMRGLRIVFATPHSAAPRLAGIVTASMVLLSPFRGAAQGGCTAEPLMVQVLGSGGPNATAARASSGYLVWRDGRAVVMVDAGGGTFLRFGDAGARLADLSLLAISHVHADHSSDVPALLWLSETARQQPLRVAGPSGAGAFPSIEGFLTRLFDSIGGAFPVMSGTLGQNGQGVRLDVTTIDATAATPVTVLTDGDLEVRALGVPHGNVPTIAYRVRVGDRSVVFGSDQNGSNPAFASFAAGADVLVLHLTIGREAPEPLARLHARPTTVGEMARAAGPGRLVLSHLGKAPPTLATPQWFSLAALDQAVAEVKRSYAGPVETAVDLQCISLGR